MSIAAKNVKDKQYAEQIIIYDAGSNRTAFVGTWKAIALFQFGVCTVWLAPHLYYNENQPDKKIRILQAVGVTLLATIPSIILSVLTAPYVTSVKLWPIPPLARRSLPALRNFAANLPSTTKLTFQTLRIFPMPKHTTVYVHELRALPSRKFRFANIELPRGEAWKQKQKQKGWLKRAWEFIEERRFKFYVKEGRVYTMRTGVPGVWEEVARGIRERTERGAQKVETKKEGKGKVIEARKVEKPSSGKVEVKRSEPSVKRQTARKL